MIWYNSNLNRSLTLIIHLNIRGYGELFVVTYLSQINHHWKFMNSIIDLHIKLDLFIVQFIKVDVFNLWELMEITFYLYSKLSFLNSVPVRCTERLLEKWIIISCKFYTLDFIDTNQWFYWFIYLNYSTDISKCLSQGTNFNIMPCFVVKNVWWDGLDGFNILGRLLKWFLIQNLFLITMVHEFRNSTLPNLEEVHELQDNRGRDIHIQRATFIRIKHNSCLLLRITFFV